MLKMRQIQFVKSALFKQGFIMFLHRSPPTSRLGKEKDQRVKREKNKRQREKGKRKKMSVEKRKKGKT